MASRVVQGSAPKVLGTLLLPLLQAGLLMTRRRPQAALVAVRGAKWCPRRKLQEFLDLAARSQAACVWRCCWVRSEVMLVVLRLLAAAMLLVGLLELLCMLAALLQEALVAAVVAAYPCRFPSSRVRCTDVRRCQHV